MSTMAFRAHKERRRITLSVTPLIDVLFLLIIFFTLTSTFKRVGELELQLPDSATASPEGGDQENVVELIVTEEGNLLLDGEELEAADLLVRFREIRKENEDARVMIKAETGVDHGEVVRLLDVVRSAGFPGVGIGTHMQGDAGI